MGTRSRIGIQNVNGTVTSIYCHWNGYPSYNGRILLENYKNGNDVSKLIALGDISSLGRKPISYMKRQMNMGLFSRKESVTKREAKLNNYGNEKCVPYSIRGDKLHSVTSTSIRNVDGWEEYEYLFRGNEWVYRGAHSKVWHKLTPKAVED